MLVKIATPNELTSDGDDVYEKHADGKLEIWFSRTLNFKSHTSLKNGILFCADSISVPNKIKIVKPIQIEWSISSSGKDVASGINGNESFIDSKGTTTGNVYCISLDNDTTAFNKKVNFHCIATWK